jgi:hypothetical protein
MKFFCSICAITLLLALFPMPIEYYTFLRIIIAIGAIVVLTQEIKKDITLIGITFVSILIIFNPVIPIYLYKKMLWMPIDFGTAVLFLMYGFKDQIKYKP